MSDKVMKNHDFVFALDIGTRSIVGILGRKENSKINIENIAVEFHEKRAMYNGQIHDIDGVVESVKKVKTSLEKELGYTLEHVSIAAAGRSLKTKKVTVEREIDSTKNINKDIINSLEIEGLQKAQNELEKESEDSTKYFCVGHTIMNYYIDDSFITNPLDHKANKMKIEILATFLPQIVVDSLYSVMSKLNLEIRYMTLEPIAAIEVAIPQNARLLNLALVDIGAGTSDIAITKDGTIVAYSMISKAGDHITEEISKKYLLDFDSAENLKVNLCKQKVQKFSDIVGISHEIDTEDILNQIKPSIKELAKLIASNIVEQNGSGPSAVFLIGGGSQIPYLNVFIAEELKIPKERVVVKGLDIIKNTIDISDSIAGPEYITPVGILTKSINNIDLDFIEIYVNDRQFKLFKTKKLKVKDALVLASLNPRSLIPKRGKSINITINEEKRELHGKYGEPAQIYINETISNIESDIKNGDIIKIIPSREGDTGNYLIKNILPLENEIFVNYKSIPQIYDLTINGQKVDSNFNISEGDNVKYQKIYNVKSLCKYIDILYKDHIIKINGEVAILESKIKNNDKIDIEKKSDLEVQEKVKDKEIIKEEKNKKDFDDIKDYETIVVKCNNETVEIPKKNRDIIFVDIFDFIEFDRSEVKGKLMLILNGEDANYTDLLNNGDEIKIYWEN